MGPNFCSCSASDLESLCTKTPPPASEELCPKLLKQSWMEQPLCLTSPALVLVRSGCGQLSQPLSSSHRIRREITLPSLIPAAGSAQAPSAPAKVSRGKDYAEARRGSLDRQVTGVSVFRI
ncbi:uncharacterized protein ACIBXB_014024 [Morphnus guianensis]